ncbi:MAG: hypothetical protein AUJ75_02590 [Candidatus Omnitrophica bacterium CG1_02_49_10]|nr:MAG: hypothetical protein AUJ75_02590 [Candidatus Omnitrophica bacterium CG1_02_49_10]
MKRSVITAISIIVAVGILLYAAEFSLCRVLERAVGSRIAYLADVKVSVGAIFLKTGGDIAVKDITIRKRDGSGPAIEAKGITLDYRLRDIIRGRLSGFKSVTIKNGTFLLDKKHPLVYSLNGRVVFSRDGIALDGMKAYLMGLPLSADGNLSGPSFKKASADLSLKFESDYAKGVLHIGGKLSSPGINGLVRFFDSIDVPVDSKLDIGPAGFTLSNTDGRASLKVYRQENKRAKYIVEARIDHFDLLGRDIVTGINADLELDENAPHSPMLRGFVNSDNTIVDFIPLGGFALTFALSEEKFIIESLNIGGRYGLNGSVALGKPYDMDIRFSVKNLDLKKLAEVSHIEDIQFISGILNGVLSVKGPLSSFAINGNLKADSGNLGYIKYESITINMNGTSPIVNITDSKIARREGAMLLRGYLDFRKMGKKNFFEDLKVLSDNNTIVWEGWDITKSPESAKLSIGKDVGDTFRINYNAFMNDETSMKNPGDKEDELSLEYRFRENENIKLLMRDDNEAVVVEHKLKF